MIIGKQIFLQCDMCAFKIENIGEGEFPITDYKGELDLGIEESERTAGKFKECPECGSKKFNLVVQ